MLYSSLTNTDNMDFNSSLSTGEYPKNLYKKCGNFFCLREGTNYCSKDGSTCVCIDGYSGPECNTVLPYRPPPSGTSCDSINPSYGTNRVEVGWFSNDCDNITITEHEYTPIATSYDGRVKLVQNACASYYYSPSLFGSGSSVICDGIPFQKSELEWICQNGTQCTPP